MSETGIYYTTKPFVICGGVDGLRKYANIILGYYYNFNNDDIYNLRKSLKTNSKMQELVIDYIYRPVSSFIKKYNTKYFTLDDQEKYFIQKDVTNTYQSLNFLIKNIEDLAKELDAVPEKKNEFLNKYVYEELCALRVRVEQSVPFKEFYATNKKPTSSEKSLGNISIEKASSIVDNVKERTSKSAKMKNPSLKPTSVAKPKIKVKEVTEDNQMLQ